MKLCASLMTPAALDSDRLTLEEVGLPDDVPATLAGIAKEWSLKPTQIKLYCVDGKPIELGRGGFGVVFYARLDRQDAAIKVIFGGQRDAQAELMREVTVLARVVSDYVVRFLGYTVCGGGMIMAMEFMEGGSLYHALQSCDDFRWNNRYFPTFCKYSPGMSASNAR